MDIKKVIIKNTLDEGLGSVYERVMLGELLEDLVNELNIKSVLEVACPFTKGYDNLVLMHKGVDVSVYDAKLDLKKLWKFKKKPNFLGNKPTKKYELVWNFAAAQTNPKVIEDMKRYSKKYVLVFTPNIFNYGTPFHFAYHLAANVECTHAERGSKALRTTLGLKSGLKKAGIKPIKCGYFDVPWWPDTAASFSEVKKNVFRKDISSGEQKIKDTISKSEKAEKYLELINKWSFLEKNPIFEPVKFLFAHHQYVLGEV